MPYVPCRPRVISRWKFPTILLRGNGQSRCRAGSTIPLAECGPCTKPRGATRISASSDPLPATVTTTPAFPMKTMSKCGIGKKRSVVVLFYRNLIFYFYFKISSLKGSKRVKSIDHFYYSISNFLIPARFLDFPFVVTIVMLRYTNEIFYKQRSPS